MSTLAILRGGPYDGDLVDLGEVDGQQGRIVVHRYGDHGPISRHAYDSAEGAAPDGPQPYVYAGEVAP